MLTGKTALVTGAGGGIGREIAARLKAAGANVAICGRNVEKLEAAAHAIGGALTLPGDLLDDTYVQSCVDRTVETFGGLDILINNAGVALSKPFGETTIAEFDRIMATNARAPFVLIHSALPHLRRARGRIINIASVVAHKGYPLQSAYAASKHATFGLIKSATLELAAFGIHCNCICPGGIETPMIRRLEEMQLGHLPTREQRIAAFCSLYPDRRYCRPEEVAYMALYLASDVAAHVNGSGFRLDGGMDARD